MTLEEAYRLAIDIRDHFGRLQLQAIGTFTEAPSDRWGVSALILAQGRRTVIWKREDLEPFCGTLVRICTACQELRPLYAATCECGSTGYQVVGQGHRPGNRKTDAECVEGQVPAGMLF